MGDSLYSSLLCFNISFEWYIFSAFFSRFPTQIYTLSLSHTWYKCSSLYQFPFKMSHPWCSQHLCLVLHLCWHIQEEFIWHLSPCRNHTMAYYCNIIFIVSNDNYPSLCAVFLLDVQIIAHRIFLFPVDFNIFALLLFQPQPFLAFIYWIPSSILRAVFLYSSSVSYLPSLLTTWRVLKIMPASYLC